MTNSVKKSENHSALVHLYNNAPLYKKAFEYIKLIDNEKKIIGEMLVEFFETEKSLDALIAGWFYPHIFERYDILVDYILIFTPLGKKLELVNDYNILEKTIVNEYWKIVSVRNKLAHRRTDDKRIGKIMTEEKKNQFIKDCRFIRDEISKRSSQILKEFESHMKDELSGVLLNFAGTLAKSKEKNTNKAK